MVHAGSVWHRGIGKRQVKRMTPKLHIASAEVTGEFEAVTEAELVQVPEGLAGLELPRRSGESGVRPSPAAVQARVEAAMAASARIEATLADLFRTAKFLSASITAVRDANGELERELEVLCSVVDGAGAQRTGLERRIQLLERVVDETSRDATREREFLVGEHDAFISSLISDHEKELESLRRRLSELSEPPPPARSENGEEV
jgi:chromosome segregation ATPase